LRWTCAGLVCHSYSLVVLNVFSFEHQCGAATPTSTHCHQTAQLCNSGQKEPFTLIAYQCNALHGNFCGCLRYNCCFTHACPIDLYGLPNNMLLWLTCLPASRIGLSHWGPSIALALVKIMALGSSHL
jgi:hypothetical protein